MIIFTFLLCLSLRLSLHLLFNGRDMFCLNLSFGQELRGYSSLKEQPLLGHLYQNESNQLSYVHPTGHLFKPDQNETAALSDALQFPLVISSSL